MAMTRWMKGWVAAAMILAGAMAAQPARADLFNFGYGGFLAGTAIGTLQVDGNTVLVTGFASLFMPTPFNLDLMPVPFVDAFTAFQNSSPQGPGVMTLNGQFMDLIACSTIACDVAFDNIVSLLYQPVDFSLVGINVPGEISATGDFDPRLWQMTQVPEPATLALLGVGLAGLGAMRRRRAA